MQADSRTISAMGFPTRSGMDWMQYSLLVDKWRKPMIEATLEPPRRRSHFHLEWVIPALVYPRETFARIAAGTRWIWITPLTLVSLSTLAYVATAGWLRSIVAAGGQPQLPADFQYYPPEMQAQIMQALQATSGPVFLYVFPALVSLATLWVGWLLLSGLLHLILTLLGGRGSIGTTLNLVAWAGLPIVLRDTVRTIAMLSTHQLIAHPGLSG
jgi:Yip1 domain